MNNARLIFSVNTVNSLLQSQRGWRAEILGPWSFIKTFSSIFVRIPFYRGVNCTSWYVWFPQKKKDGKRENDGVILPAAATGQLLLEAADLPTQNNIISHDHRHNNDSGNNGDDGLCLFYARNKECIKSLFPVCHLGKKMDLNELHCPVKAETAVTNPAKQLKAPVLWIS